jgi:hypothetical protein
VRGGQIRETLDKIMITIEAGVGNVEVHYIPLLWSIFEILHKKIFKNNQKAKSSHLQRNDY